METPAELTDNSKANKSLEVSTKLQGTGTGNVLAARDFTNTTVINNFYQHPHQNLPHQLPGPSSLLQISNLNLGDDSTDSGVPDTDNLPNTKVPSQLLRAVVYKEASWSSSKLKIPLGTTLSLEFASKGFPGTNKQVPLTVGPSENVFFGLFEEDDVDFLLCIDNSRCFGRDVCFTLQLQQKSYGFVVRQGDCGRIRTVKSNGGKFHFVKQSGAEGQAIISQVATEHEISFASAEELVSQIKFTVAYSKLQGLGQGISVFVKTDTGRTIRLEVLPNATVFELKSMLHEITGESPNTLLTLIHYGRTLNDSSRLCDYEIQDCSTIHLILRTMGGGGCCEELCGFTNPECINRFNNKFKEELKGMILEETEGGVICLGDPSSQQFVPADFNEDYSIPVAPFVVEMRMKSRYKPV